MDFGPGKLGQVASVPPGLQAVAGELRSVRAETPQAAEELLQAIADALVPKDGIYQVPVSLKFFPSAWQFAKDLQELSPTQPALAKHLLETLRRAVEVSMGPIEIPVMPDPFPAKKAEKDEPSKPKTLPKKQFEYVVLTLFRNRAVLNLTARGAADLIRRELGLEIGKDHVFKSRLDKMRTREDWLTWAMGEHDAAIHITPEGEARLTALSHPAGGMFPQDQRAEIESLPGWPSFSATFGVSPPGTSTARSPGIET